MGVVIARIADLNEVLWEKGFLARALWRIAGWFYV